MGEEGERSVSVAQGNYFEKSTVINISLPDASGKMGANVFSKIKRAQ